LEKDVLKKRITWLEDRARCQLWWRALTKPLREGKMYYKLKNKYNLRGWEKLPYAIVDTEAHRASFVDKGTFAALDLCNGRIDLALPLVPQSIRDSVKKLEAQGIVALCAPGEGIAERQKYRRYPNRFMQSAHWSITGRCNCKCRHCYLSAAEGRYGELSHDDIM
jgi:hypothetical protein